MPAENDNSILLRNRLDSYNVELNYLLQSLESVGAADQRQTTGLFSRHINLLRHDLAKIEELVDKQAHTQAWESLTKLQLQTQRVMEAAQGFLGGLGIRQATLDQGMADRALFLAGEFSRRTGGSELRAVVFSPSVHDWQEAFVVAKDAGDDIVHMPIPHWDIWHLPLVAHDYGYWVAKHGDVKEFDAFIAEQISVVNHEIAPSPEKTKNLLPELRRALDQREQYGPALDLYCARQKVHLWHLIADALATYLIGPAYAHALVFLVLNPTDPFIEGERASAGNARSRFLPSDARRAAIVFDVLKRMSDKTKPDQHTDGIYDPELRLSETVWERALDASGVLKQYQDLNLDLAGWRQSIYEILELNFGFVLPETAKHWREGLNSVVPVLQDGGEVAAQVSLEAKIHGAWWCRPRYPDRTASLSRDCARLLNGASLQGMQAQPVEIKEETTRLLTSRFYEIEQDLNRFKDLFNSGYVERSDRNVVAGRFYRLISERDYRLKGLQRLLKTNPPPTAVLAQVIQQADGNEMQALQRETLDFLGGVLMRKQNIDRGICTMAEALLGDYSGMTGVNWASRVVLGANPLFSLASDIVHHRFPDWDIWNLPLLAHEFGHIIFAATPAFKDELAEELVNAGKEHPEREKLTEEALKDYVSKRTRHLEEFFADGFAVYCQGPAFVYNVLLLHLNPAEAYLARGYHPSHAERVEFILQVLREMNQQQKLDKYANDPFESVLNRFQEWWPRAVESAGVQPGPVERFHKLKAKTLASKFYRFLNKYYRLGAQYQATDWNRANDAAGRLLESDNTLNQESLRNLLNIAWACRVRYPGDVVRIAKIIRLNFELALTRA